MTTNQELRKLAEEATPGPWWNEGENEHVYANVKGGRPNGEGLLSVSYYSRARPNSAMDAKYIAAANPAKVIELLDRIDRLEAENDKLDQLSDQYMDKVDKLLAENEAQRKQLDALLAHCPVGECSTCSKIICPHKDPLHFHHDGCPSCCATTDHLKGKNHG